MLTWRLHFCHFYSFHQRVFSIDEILDFISQVPILTFVSLKTYSKFWSKFSRFHAKLCESREDVLYNSQTFKKKRIWNLIRRNASEISKEETHLKSHYVHKKKEMTSCNLHSTSLVSHVSSLTVMTPLLTGIWLVYKDNLSSGNRNSTRTNSKNQLFISN